MKFSVGFKIMKLKNKLFASAVAFTMVLSLVAVPASAQTTAELTAQINSLLAMIAQLQAQIASITTGGYAATTFTKDLTVGSTGAEVSALQQFLVSKGFLTMPAGVAYGYFGSLTKAALAGYQASVGIAPAAGYFGPITRAHLNALTPTTTPGSTTVGAITTPGVEGTLSVSSNNSGLVSTIYEGDENVAILGFNVEAKNSDIAVQRVKLDLGDTTQIYNKIYSKIYVTDGSNVLASSDLNSSTVVKDNGRYYITLTGFNFVVSKDAKKQVVIKADVMPTIDSTLISQTYTVRLAENGVRGVDGAGIDQYAGGTSITKSVTTAKSLTDSAALKMSLNNSSPKKSEVVASEGSNNNELDKLSVLVFDVKAEKDNVTLDDLKVNFVVAGGNANVSTVYLYEGSTELDNASLNDNVASFTGLDYNISKDATKTLTVKVDVRNAGEDVTTITASASASDLVAENSVGDTVARSGSANGYDISVRSAGLEIALVSRSITTNGVTQASDATSTLTATFNVRVKALGDDITLGTVASSNPMFNNTNSFAVYKNGVAYDDHGSTVAVSYTLPSSCTPSEADNCVLAEGNEITFPVTFQIYGRQADGTALTSGIYSVGIAQVQWGYNKSSTFMAGEIDWSTSEVSFP